MVTYGGIYMDTDVEVIKPLDGFLGHEALSGFESKTQIPTGLMACRAGFPLFEELLHEYDDISFLNEDGSYDLTTNVVRITNTCLKYGFIPNGEYQEVNGFALYPKEWFCPIDLETLKKKTTKKTHTIHWFSGSWLTNEQKKKVEEEQKNSRKWQRKNKIHYIVHFPNRLIRTILGNDCYENFKGKIK